MEVGICQTKIIPDDKKYNLIQAEDYIAGCSYNGAGLVLFPEMSMTGYKTEPGLIAETVDDSYTVNTIKELAVKYNVAVGIGYVLYKDGKYTNHYTIVDRHGKVISDYDKIHPFSYAGEDEKFEKGDRLSFCEIDGITVCTFICYDLRFPEIFQIASQKADLIVVAANWDGNRDEHWRLLLCARALENQCYVIGVNRVGSDEDNYCIGNSMVIDPYGRIMDVLEAKEGIMMADINKEVVDAYRKEFPVKKDRRPDLYRKLTNF